MPFSLLSASMVNVLVIW